MHLSDSTFSNIENDPSTSQEVTGAYLSEEIWDKVSLYKILLGKWGLEIVVYQRKQVQLRV